MSSSSVKFRTRIGQKYESKVKIEYAFQELDNLPEGYTCPEGRVKPWGTGHAILTADPYINEPFFVINGDDFYGAESFRVAASYYAQGADDFSMVAFQMDRTLSEFGPVTRGVCQTEDAKLATIVETEGLEKVDNKVISARNVDFDGSEPVSMNMWGFTPRLFDYLKEKFVLFMEAEGSELKSEYLIPTVINELIEADQEHVSVIKSPASWFGVTYKDDKPHVVNKVQELIDSGEYPNNLF